MAALTDRATPHVLCTGISVLDEVFRVDEFPPADSKAMALDFIAVGGGCAANAAVAIARLGARVSYAGPVGGPAGTDSVGDRILANLANERVETSGCVRHDGVSSPLSAIIVNRRGERTIVTYRDSALANVTPRDPAKLIADVDIVLADNRYPNFTGPLTRAARARGIPVVLDADRPTRVDDPQFAAATHVVFSSEALRATAGTEDLAAALHVVGPAIPAFLAVTNGEQPMLWRDQAGAIQQVLPFTVKAVDTLAAGDAFHGAFALALAEGQTEVAAMRFASAVAAVKCQRFGGSAAAPTRVEVEAFLAAAGR